MTRPPNTVALAKALAGISLDEVEPAPDRLQRHFELRDFETTIAPSTLQSAAKKKAAGTSPGFVEPIQPVKLDTRISRVDNLTHVPGDFAKPEFTRYDMHDLEQLANLPPRANILLLTPIIEFSYWKVSDPPGDTTLPYRGGTTNGLEILNDHNRQIDRTNSANAAKHDIHFDRFTYDPFEDLGRSLSVFHKRIRHVPYVTAVGFTQTHAKFISEAGGVIIVVCEPGGEFSPGQSVEHQMDFATTVHKTILQKNATTAANGNSYSTLAEVLVQCASPPDRADINDDFHNVLEVSKYTSVTAKLLAQRIFQCKTGAQCKTCQV